MRRPRGVASSQGTLLEVALQDITSRECIPAKHAHVRAITSVYSVSRIQNGAKKKKKHTSQQMALEMLGVQICLVAVRTWELPIRILGGDGGVFGSGTIDAIGSHGSRAARDAGKDATTALRADDLGARGILGRVRRSPVGTRDGIGVHPGRRGLSIRVAKSTRRQP